MDTLPVLLHDPVETVLKGISLLLLADLTGAGQRGCLDSNVWRTLHTPSAHLFPRVPSSCMGLDFTNGLLQLLIGPSCQVTPKVRLLQ